MDCIRCNIRMNKEIKNDVIIDKCPVCDGLWLDYDELEMLQSGEGTKYSTLISELYRENELEEEFKKMDGLCPKCKQTPLEIAILDGVEVDRCPSCKGMFFDWGEVEEVLNKRAQA